MLSKKFDEALTFAAELHREQVRKGADTPYVGHLLSVAGLVLENKGTEAQAIAALLHDAIEDQAASFGGAAALGAEIERRFGKDVRAIVEACTDAWVEPKPEWRERKEKYIAHVGHMPADAVLVSLADKLHNARAICADLRAHGPAVFERFRGGRDGTVWYYESLAEAFGEHHPCPLAAELGRAVDEMRNLTFGCGHCWPASPEAAWEAQRKPERELVDESHFGAHITRCDACGQRFLVIFTETIDWSDGDDPQYWTIIPVTADEVEALARPGQPPSEAELSAVGPGRRSLWRNAPKGKPIECFWNEGVGLLVHD